MYVLSAAIPMAIIICKRNVEVAMATAMYAMPNNVCIITQYVCMYQCM
jgi:hypothetical protein